MQQPNNQYHRLKSSQRPTKGCRCLSTELPPVSPIWFNLVFPGRPNIMFSMLLVVVKHTCSAYIQVLSRFYTYTFYKSRYIEGIIRIFCTVTSRDIEWDKKEEALGVFSPLPTLHQWWFDNNPDNSTPALGILCTQCNRGDLISPDELFHHTSCSLKGQTSPDKLRV